MMRKMDNNFKFLIIFSATILFSGIAPALTSVYAAEAPMAASVQANPFYWSEDGFGIQVLKNYDLPLDTYLTPGVTEESSNEEIIDAYLEANPDHAAKVIVPDEDRAQIIVAHFSDGLISEEKTITTFSKFTPKNPFDAKQFEFSLSSLPSIDKLEFYKYVEAWKDEGLFAQQLFDVDIEIISGDGTTLQVWEYASCEITDYVLFKKEKSDIYSFTRVFLPEFRDTTTFLCGAFTLNTEQQQSDFQKTFPKDVIPENSERVQAFAVRFSDGLLSPSTSPFTTFSKFTHFFDLQDISIQTPVQLPEIQLPGKTFGGKVQFSLESLPNKEHEIFYKGVNNWINERFDERFDVSIDYITGDGTILQTWEYSNCEITDYSTFLMESLLTFKFSGQYPAEIRDKTDFVCGAFRMVFDQGKSTIEADIIEPHNLIPDEDSRAQIFVAHFSNGKIERPITITSFSKFSPSSPFDSGSVQFDLESYPSKDKQQIYKLVKDWLDKTLLDTFDADIEVISRDGTIIQTWEYRECNIIDYNASLNDNLLNNKFDGERTSRIRDLVTFDCGSVFLNSSQRESSLGISEINSVNFVPSIDDSPQKFVVKASDGLRTEPIVLHSFSKFTPYSPFDNDALGFTLESLPSTETKRNYKIINDWKNGINFPYPFDVDVEYVTGDGTILQTWKFRDCGITDYVTYLYDKLLKIKFHGDQNFEIRDKISFECNGFSLDISHRMSSPTTDSIPDDSQRAQKFVIYFRDSIEGEITMPVQKFIPVNAEGMALPFPGKTFDVKPVGLMFSTLPNKDFIPIYKMMGMWESGIGIRLVPDAIVHVFSSDGTIIQTWEYGGCIPTNYYTTLSGSILSNPLSEEFGIEIVDSFFMACAFFRITDNVWFSTDSNALKHDPFSKIWISSQSDTLKHDAYSNYLSPYKQMKQGTLPHELLCKEGYELILKPNNSTSVCVKPSSLEKLSKIGWIYEGKFNIDKPESILQSDRADSFVVRLSGGPIQEEKVYTTFSSFAPISDKVKIPVHIPNYPFGGASPLFALEGLPSKDKLEFYQIVNDWLTENKARDRFDASIDVVTGDETILQTWEYKNCEVSEYVTALSERLDKIKYHDKYASEIIDKTSFRCQILDINAGI